MAQEKIEAFFEQILSKTEDLWNNFIDEAKGFFKSENIYPWDIKYFLHSKINPLPDYLFPATNIIASFKRLLLRYSVNFDDLPIKIIYRDIPFGGISITVEPGKDIRVIADPRNGHKWYSILFHELGHAVHGSSILEPSYLIALGDPEFFWEGIACIFQNFCYEKNWLINGFFLDEKIVNQFLSKRIFDLIYKYRRLIVDSIFEYRMYQNPPEDPDSLYRQLYYDILKIELPEKYPVWAGESIYVVYPIYNQNYIIADAISAQTRSYFTSKFGSIFHREFLAYLKENYILAGAFIPWRKKIEIATEKTIRTDDLIEEIETLSKLL